MSKPFDFSPAGDANRMQREARSEYPSWLSDEWSPVETVPLRMLPDDAARFELTKNPLPETDMGEDTSHG